LDRISADIGKLPWSVKQRGSDGVGRPVPNAKLERPNGFQTPSQFRRAWVLALLQQGNAVVLKEPDLIVLDWNRVTPMVSPSGEVFYQVSTPATSLLPGRFAGRTLAIPADAVMHDRGACLYHELIGVAPLTAAYLPAAKNWYALDNVKTRFSRGNKLGGLVAVPPGLTDADATALRTYWASLQPDDVRVLGSDAKFIAFDVKSTDAQLVEQLQLSDKQICAPFHIPSFLINAESLPSGQRPDQYLDTYFKLALQHIIVGIESQLTAGLGLPAGQYVEIDTGALLRMDQASRGAFYKDMVGAGIVTRNEARRAFDLPPVEGGDVITVQVQDVPLGGQVNG
jgi:HK97 family phage portal protein